MPAWHEPVMVEEVLRAMALKPGAVVVDGTLGHAGHALRMLEVVGKDGMLVGMDWDQEMLKMAMERLAGHEGQVSLHHGDYRSLPQVVQSALAVRDTKPDAILLDLGLNNAQIEDPSRGITFKGEGPLDMRIDRSKGEPASAVLNRMSPAEIEDVLFDLGDERWARRISQVIVERRKQKPLRTTQDLVDCVLAAIPSAKRDKRIHPATRTFQAVRIYVNDELEGLEDALFAAGMELAKHGVLVVLSYHSGEDRAAKHAIRRLVETEEFQDLYKKPLAPSAEEVARNPKSRSAKLRAVQRIH